MNKLEFPARITESARSLQHATSSIGKLMPCKIDPDDSSSTCSHSEIAKLKKNLIELVKHHNEC